MILGHLKSTRILWVDRLSTGPPDLGCHRLCERRLVGVGVGVGVGVSRLDGGQGWVRVILVFSNFCILGLNFTISPGF